VLLFSAWLHIKKTQGPGSGGVRKRRTLSNSYKEKYYTITSTWKDAKRAKIMASTLGHLVLNSFQEISSCPPIFQHLAKGRARAYLERYFLQDEMSRPHVQAPSEHGPEYHYRVRVALDHLMSSKREAFRVLDYKLAFLLHGEKREPGKEVAPSWAPCRIRQQMVTMGPKIRTVFLTS